MGTGATADLNSPYNPTNPNMRHNGLVGRMATTIGRANAEAGSKRIDQFVTDDNARLQRIADRRQNWANLRSDYDARLTRARSGGTTPTFTPGQQVFK